MIITISVILLLPTTIHALSLNSLVNNTVATALPLAQTQNAVIIPNPVATVTVTTTLLTLKPTSSPDERPQPQTCARYTAPNAKPKAAWASPRDMKDLSSFGVSTVSTGKDNLKLVYSSTGPGNSVPAHPHHAPAGYYQPPDASAESTAPRQTLLQILYPAHSINPGRKPIGGAQFYGNPLGPSFERARTVTFGYSAFFPRDFDFVKGGKMPGLYGGTKGCSGGNAAIDCFSTRLMWRKDGFGELYLYAPKDKQTRSLCSDPQSVCDAAYGLSVGRGSFRWKRYEWTRVEQRVTLNTPGKQDGKFTLLVNGKCAIHREDVYFRGAGAPARESDPGFDVGGIKIPTQPATLLDQDQEYFAQAEPAARQVGFSGMFFSTFFGGHDDAYATPRDQYTWFTNFTLSYM